MSLNGQDEAGLSTSLIGQWPEPMLLIDGERFIDANPAAISLLGYPDKSALLGRTPAEISPVLQPDGELSAAKGPQFLHRAQCGETVRFEWVCLTSQEQTIHIDVTLSPFTRDGKQLVLCAWHEIGKLKLAEQAAREANEALMKSNRELQHFAHVAAHDLQTPLRTISVFAQLLHQEVLSQVNEQARQWASFVIDGSRRMQGLIENLLSYTRLEAKPLLSERVDSQCAFAEAKSNLVRQITESGADIEAGQLPEVLAEHTQLVQLLQNLIENGIKYNQSATPRVKLTAQRDGEEWIFSVSDNGIGIHPKYQHKIFEMFQRLHTGQEYPGTGIGLAICQRIVERHGGRIWVESAEGCGSVFRFALPAATTGCRQDDDRCRPATQAHCNSQPVITS